ncbi:hypothetical protein G7Y89_g2215 [Cudoniella acicularis]|uniref:Glycoside hydrolase 131 catalytic N-terminal domain-containing protein n=1 Tax=Cudoniella acicularis TaxID=354080 RepID=A0A8H4RVI7_9HELO|nr:hypothetical protein G7Y89_g2215 [Cudoniella acicularis]
MRRTELIPQTTAAINKGTVYYHFSMQRTATNAPSKFREHQIAFFESHFTDMKAGWISGESGTGDSALRWDVSSTTMWNTTWEAGVWHNIAYEINFDASSVAFYHSTGADDLTLAHEAVTVSASSNGADWHLGVLELPRDGYTDGIEDIYFSGVYVESGELITSVSGPGGSSNSTSSDTVSVVASTAAASSSAIAAVSTSALVSTTSTSSVIATSIAAVLSSVASVAVNIESSTTFVTLVSSSSSTTPSSIVSSTSSTTSTVAPSATEATLPDDGGDDNDCE